MFGCQKGQACSRVWVGYRETKTETETEGARVVRERASDSEHRRPKRIERTGGNGSGSGAR